MAFEDWEFLTNTTEGGPSPSDISIDIDSILPLAGTGSLEILDAGQPLNSAFAAHPKTSLFDIGHNYGKVRSIIKKDVGLGFRDSGIFFMCDSPDPTLSGSRFYFLEIADGATNIKVKKATNGLLDEGNVTLLQGYVDSPSVPMPNNAAEVVCEVEWLSGLFLPSLGGVQIKIRFWQNSINFNDMVELSPIVLDTTDPVVFSQREGIYARSRNSLEPLNAKFDDTRITRFDITP